VGYNGPVVENETGGGGGSEIAVAVVVSILLASGCGFGFCFCTKRRSRKEDLTADKHRHSGRHRAPERNHRVCSQPLPTSTLATGMVPGLHK
jgi:hypothetical protein